MGKLNFKLSTISSKVIMAIAGLFLMSFLVVHLLINMLMLIGDEGILFSKAADFMTSNLGIKVFEYILFAGFIIHMIIGVMVELRNYFVRPVKYAVASKSKTSCFSRYMIHTGIIIFLFLILHFTHFFFVKLGWVSVPEGINDTHDFFTMTKYLFKAPVYSIIYVICFIFLGFHLNHAFQSAFQTLGLNHPTYTPVIKVISTIYGLCIAIGFSLIPIYFYFFY